MDHEHREIVGLVNELSTTLDAEPSSMALRVLGDLYAYIAAHFALEERMMRERGYDEYHDHKADHGLLLDALRDLLLGRSGRVGARDREEQEQHGP